MPCPDCKNAGFLPSKEVPRATTIYRTERFRTVKYRYHVCLQCGAKWKTKEIFDKKVTASNKKTNV